MDTVKDFQCIACVSNEPDVPFRRARRKSASVELVDRVAPDATLPRPIEFFVALLFDKIK